MGTIPAMTPLFPGAGTIHTSIRYENCFTTVDDITHDEDHIHDFYEIYVNLRGDVSFLVDHTLYDIEQGDINLTRPNEFHRCIYHSDCIHEHFCIWFRGLPFHTEELETCLLRNTRIALSPGDKRLLTDYCFGLYNSHDADDVHRLRAAHCFLGILDLICAHRQGSAPTQNLPNRFSDIVTYISQHYAEPTCNVERICEHFFISKSTLLRRFKQHFQTAPSAYIESKRFSEAKKLLLAGSSVQEACFSSGFSDCSYFVLRFRKKFGITPHRYQKEFMDAAPEG